MNICLFQQDICWLDAEANYRKIETTLQQNPQSDLLVMPEMCTTGFITLPRHGQIEPSDMVEKRLLALANKYGTALCGSFAVQVSDTANANRCYFVTPEGNIAHYDKHHLFRPGQEHMGYQTGKSRVVVEWRCVRFLLVVCYDLRFPVWTRYREDSPYDVIICVANWPQARQLAWDTLLRARAIENQAYCIGVNRVGRDTMCDYAGGTCAIHPYGHAVASVADATEGTCSFEPDLDMLASFRQKFPSLGDADDFLIVGE
ncbi:MAG: nitrilase family protein [Bacteroidales bacterium]|nr:nitrilase family protein [Bacteroidales bacterium]